jgi:hypothetical protein
MTYGISELREVCKQLPRSRYSWNRCVLGTTEVTVLTELVWVTFFLGSSFFEEAAAGRQAFSSPFHVRFFDIKRRSQVYLDGV